MVDGQISNTDHGDEDQRRNPVDLGRAERGPGEGEETGRFEEDEPKEADHAALGLDAVLATSSLHLLAVVSKICRFQGGRKMTYGMKLRPTCDGVKCHFFKTRAKLSRPVKIRASLKPLSRERKATTGSVRRKR